MDRGLRLATSTVVSHDSLRPVGLVACVETSPVCVCVLPSILCGCSPMNARTLGNAEDKGSWDSRCYDIPNHGSATLCSNSCFACLLLFGGDGGDVFFCGPDIFGVCVP